MSDTINGSCYCEAIKFAADMPATSLDHCHCSQCRFLHGAAFVSWMEFTGAYTIDDPQDLLRWYRCEISQRGFCSNCGSTFVMPYTDRYDPRSKDNIDMIYFCRANIIADFVSDCEESHIGYHEHPAWFHLGDD